MSPAAEGLDQERERVRALLGREPQGSYEVVVRDASGDPVVLRNAPLLDDGTPMPTRFWLVGPEENRRIGRLEADGGVDAAEAAIEPEELAAAHARYAAERDAALPAGHRGPTPSGGVGGTRVGVKCLHAHWAWHLAGGDDPVGRWIEARLAAEAIGRVSVDAQRCIVRVDGDEHVIPWGYVTLTEEWLTDDPPRPDGLTNALGAIVDHLDDVLRLTPAAVDVPAWEFRGPTIRSLASVEVGRPVGDPTFELDRAAGEEVFRTVATEQATDRAHNPGLPSEHVDVIVATCCIVQAWMRHLHLDVVTLAAAPDGSDGTP